MAIISVDCTECGANNLLPAGALLATATADSVDVHCGGELTWICGACQEVVWAPVGWRSFLLLMQAGVPLLEEDLENHRPPHPEHPQENHAFTLDDLLDLHELLATDEWFSGLSLSCSSFVQPEAS